MRSPSKRKLRVVPKLYRSSSVSGNSRDRGELIAKYNAAIGSNVNEGQFPDDKSIMTSKDFACSLGMDCLITMFRCGYMVWQHGCVEDLFKRIKPAEVLAFGAKLCASRQSILEPLEELIKERTKVSVCPGGLS